MSTTLSSSSRMLYASPRPSPLSSKGMTCAAASSRPIGQLERQQTAAPFNSCYMAERLSEACPLSSGTGRLESI